MDLILNSVRFTVMGSVLFAVKFLWESSEIRFALDNSIFNRCIMMIAVKHHSVFDHTKMIVSQGHCALDSLYTVECVWAFSH